MRNEDVTHTFLQKKYGIVNVIEYLLLCHLLMVVCVWEGREGVKALRPIIFLLLHDSKGDATYFQNALALCSSLNTEETHMLCGWSYFSFRDGGKGRRMHNFCSFYLVVALETPPRPHFYRLDCVAGSQMC